MTMKTILVPVEESVVLPSMLECARLTAEIFGSYIEGFHVRPPLTGVMVADGAGAVNLMENFERQDQERAERARALFETFVNEKGIETGIGPNEGNKPRAAWLEQVSPDDQAVGSRGRLFDLIIVGRPVRGQATPTMGTLETALFESGRPLLIAPPTKPKSLGKNIVIAWNGSTETARCISFSIPFLTKAEKITVLAVEGVGVAGPSAHEMCEYLRRNGIDADSFVARQDGRNPGEAMLEEATKLGADLMVKGAYTNSRLRQMIFGGATSFILSNAEIPVFMSH